MGGPAAAAAAAGGGSTTPSVLSVAKLVVMGGIMYAARSWNNEDAKFVHQLRVAYAAVHVLIIGIVTYIFYLTNVQMAATATTTASKEKGSASSTVPPPEQQVIYVPAPAQVCTLALPTVAIFCWKLQACC
jgi:hypothetical protein